RLCPARASRPRGGAQQNRRRARVATSRRRSHAAVPQLRATLPTLAGGTLPRKGDHTGALEGRARAWVSSHDMPSGRDDLALRLQKLEDERAIAQLVYRYAELCDDAYDPDGLAGLFTEDAAWSASSPDGSVDFGRYQGREAIRAFFAGVSADLG